MFLLLSRNTFLLVALTAVTALSVAAQSVTSGDARERGIALAQQGNAGEAIVLLKDVLKENKKDIRAWHWLGVAFEKEQKPKDASKAHETAARTAEDLQSSLMEDFKSLSTTDLREAADSAEHYLTLNASLSAKKQDEWRSRADFLKLHATSYDAITRTYKSAEVTKRAQIVRREEPRYTDDARNNLVTGTVVLRCIFAADRRVRNIAVVKGLPNGLTERAIEAARKIKFIPATKEGKPVSMWMQLEYNFDLDIAP